MNRIPKIITLFILLCSWTGMEAQFYSYKQHVAHADKAFDMGNYLEAMTHYQKASELNDNMDPQSILNYGDAAYDAYALKIAEEQYNKYLLLDKASDQYMVQYKLAKLKHLQGKYEEAVIDYNIYLSEYELEDSLLSNDVKFQKTSAEWALNTPAESIVDTAKLVDTGINTPFSEHAPYLFNDKLYYNSLKFPIEDEGQDSYTSKILKELDVTEIEGSPANALISHPSFSPDGRFLFFTVGQYIDLNTINCDIYYCHVSEYGDIGTAQKASEIINKADFTSTHPSVYIDADSTYHLLFVSDRYGGKGGLDIWSSQFTENGTFVSPVNLSAINTGGDDLSPFVHQPTKNIFFSSNARSGFGGFDVYKSSISDENEPIVNLGDQINSPNNDLYYFLNEDGSKSYFSSNRPGSLFLEDKFETCCYDIYEAKGKDCSIQLEASTFDALTEEGLTDVNIKVWNKETEEIYYEGNSPEVLRSIKLPCEKDMELIASKEGYEDVIIALGDLDPIYGEENKISRSIYLKPTESVSLTINIFEEITNRPLGGADVYLTIKDTNEQKSLLSAPSHVVEFKIKPNTDYIVEINIDGYKEAVLEFNSGDEEEINKDVYMKILDVVKKALLSLENAIPVSLYFDNDKPKAGNSNVTSAETYTTTFKNYYARKEKFRAAYISRFRFNDNKVSGVSEIEDLFENHIKRGFDKYDNFKRQLLLVLENGQDVNIYLRGYASPVAQSEYNTELGKRRVDSVRKEFDQWNNGVLLPYIQSGQLKVTERSFGEETAPVGISDDISKPDSSIFSPEASKERRVEIDEINFNNN